jgi:hypothetical protein
MFSVLLETVSVRLGLLSVSDPAIKQSRYTPCRCLGGEEIELLLIHDLDSRWG